MKNELEILKKELMEVWEQAALLADKPGEVIEQRFHQKVMWKLQDALATAGKIETEILRGRQQHGA